MLFSSLPTTSLISLLTIIILFKVSYSFTTNGYFILDLETTTLLSEVDAWTLTSIRGSTKTYQTLAWNIMPSRWILGGPYILGPPGKGSASGEYFIRTYTGLKPHTFVAFTFVVWYFDDWTGVDDKSALRWEIDGTAVDGPRIYYHNDFWSYEGGKNDFYAFWQTEDSGFVHIKTGMAHTGSSMTFKITGKMTGEDANERFGFREISFILSNYSGTPNSSCHLSDELYLHEGNVMKYDRCQCPMNQYPGSNGTCTSCPARWKYCWTNSLCLQCDDGLYWSGTDCCHQYCKSCTGNSSDDCQTCHPDYYNYGNNSCMTSCDYPFKNRTEGDQQMCGKPCLSNQYYFESNDTCVDSCPSPLMSNTDENNINYCQNSCGTDAVYLHMNGSCLPDCLSPLIERLESGTKYCFTPCTPSQYLFTNSSCVNSCPSPLVSKTESDIAYCSNPCQSETLYLYTNGSCYQTCPFPLASRTEPGVKFCFTPCPSGKYLYSNQTCSARCDSPLVSQAESGVLYCFNPCPDDTLFLYPNRSCYKDCPSPLVSRSEPGTNYCSSLCPTGQYLYPNQSCFPSCLTPLARKIEPDVNFCFNPCPTEQYLFPNQSCLDNCPAPLASRSEPDVQFCFNPCPDPSTDYLYPNGTCSPQCNSPLVTKIEPDAMYCINPCPIASPYLYANQSCFSKCSSPLMIKDEPGTKFCFNPCPNPSTEYLYSNGSCLSTCIFPLATRSEPDVKYCYNPCQSNQYLYPNQTCSSKCPSPLVWKSESGVKYCFNPCLDPITVFLYPNGSCLPTCLSPLFPRAESGVKYCSSPCPPNKKYLYLNGSCLTNCPTPLLSKTESDIFYCYLPCAEPNIYWYANGSCMPNCTAPYQEVPYSGVLQCLAPCKDESYFYYHYEKACFSECESPFTPSQVEQIKVCHSDLGLDHNTVSSLKDTADSIVTQGEFTSGGMKALGTLNSKNPSSALLAGLSSMLQYIRYMKINYPPKVETLFMVSADTPLSLSFDFDIPPKINTKLDDHPLPHNFDKYDINSNFVRNMWDLIGSFITSIIVIFGLFLATKILKKYPKTRFIFQKFLNAAKWNIPAMMLCSSSGDIFFFASLHLNVLHLNDTASIICFAVLLLMVAATFGLWILALQIVQTFRTVKKGPNPVSLEDSGFKKRWEDYELLYAEYEEKSALTISYMSFFIARGFIFNLTIGCLYEFPLIQVAIINASNFLMFGYLIVYRPLKELLNLVQVFINEGLIIILSVSLLILAVMDKLNIVGTSTRVGVGDTILFVIQAFNTIALVFMGVQLSMMLIFAVKAIIYFREKGIKNPLKMLQIIIFEEFEQEAGIQNCNNSLADISKKHKPRRMERITPFPNNSNNNTLTMTTDPHQTTSENLLTGISTRNIRRFNRRLRTPLQSNQTQPIEIEASETQSRLDLFFNPSPAISALKDSEIILTLDQPETLNQSLSEEEIRNSLNKSMRKLRSRAKTPSPLKILNSGNLKGEGSLELDKLEKAENQNETSQIILFPESTFGRGINETNTINLFSETYNTITVNENHTIYDSLRKLKERRRRAKMKEDPEEKNKVWLNQMRKYKESLKKKE